MITIEILSDGEPVEITRLGMFELSEIKAKLIGPYTYEVETESGRTYLAEYDGSLWKNEKHPPLKPSKPEDEIEKGSDEWYDLVEFLRYQAWIVHERQRNALMNEYHQDVARYILKHCLKPEDVSRIVTPEDWAKVHKAALVPELTLEVLAETLRATFQGIVWRHVDI